MSGNVWMFSDEIDDEDLEFMSHDYVTYGIERWIDVERSNSGYAGCFDRVISVKAKLINSIAM